MIETIEGVNAALQENKARYLEQGFDLYTIEGQSAFKIKRKDGEWEKSVVFYHVTTRNFFGRERHWRHAVEIYLPTSEQEIQEVFKQSYEEFKKNLSNPELVFFECMKHDMQYEPFGVFNPDGGDLGRAKRE